MRCHQQNQPYLAVRASPAALTRRTLADDIWRTVRLHPMLDALCPFGFAILRRLATVAFRISGTSILAGHRRLDPVSGYCTASSPKVLRARDAGK